MAAALAKGETAHRERRERARDRRCRALPRRHGRQDRRHRHAYPAHPGQRPARGRAAHRAARSHRERHLRDGRRGDGRRRAARGRASTSIWKRPSTSCRRSASTVEQKPNGLRIARNGRGLDRRRCRDAALPRLPDRPAGPADGADDDGERHLHHPRDDLREPVHACAGAGAARRRHHATRRPWRASAASSGWPARR